MKNKICKGKLGLVVSGLLFSGCLFAEEPIVVSQQYDAFNRLSTQQQNDIGVNYHYNAIGLLEGVSTGKSSSLLQADVSQFDYDLKYDQFNRVIERTEKNGFKLSYSYYPDGSLCMVVVSKRSLDVGHLKYLYIDDLNANPLSNGKILKIEADFVQNGINQKDVFDYEYDDFGRQSKVTHSDNHGNVLSISDEYDEQQRVIKQIYQDTSPSHPDDHNLNKTLYYTYDAYDRLAKSETKLGQYENSASNVVEYRYDLNGNITHQLDTTTMPDLSRTIETIFTYNEIDQLLEREVITTISESGQKPSEIKEKEIYHYDTNGNLIEQIKDGKLIKSYRYNARNQMVEFINHEEEGEDRADKHFNYTYFPGGHRASKTSDQASINFSYDEQGQLMNSEYIHRSLQGNIDAHQMDSNLPMYRYIADKIGNNDVLQMGISSTTKRTSKTTEVHSNGTTKTQSYNINDYGKLEDANNNFEVKELNADFDFNQNPYVYGSGYLDTESGLQYMGARYYSPELQRFMAQDSYNLINRYNYANGNPIMNYDPDGHWALPNWANYALNGLAVVTGVAATIASGGTLGLPLAAALLGTVSGVSGIAEQAVRDTHGESDVANKLALASTITGLVALPLDIYNGFNVGSGISKNIKSKLSISDINPSILEDDIGIGKFEFIQEDEIYYRTMGFYHYKQLRSTNKLAGSKETFISSGPNAKQYSSQYAGYLVKFRVKNGTLDKLAEIGLSNNLTANDINRLNLKSGPIKKGWRLDNTQFKKEQGILTIGLGSNKGLGLKIFNENLISYERVYREAKDISLVKLDSIPRGNKIKAPNKYLKGLDLANSVIPEATL